MTYFGFNALHISNELEKQSDEEIIVAVGKHCKVEFPKGCTVVDIRRKNPVQYLLFMYHLATADRVVVDNYYGFLAAAPFKKGTLCIQVWHAAGAIKKFGLEDASVKQRSAISIRRFHAVYDRFDYVVAGSEKMADIFKRSFGLPDERILRTGVPRTDFFYENDMDGYGKKMREIFEKKHPEWRNKKILLYTPTFRGDERQLNELPFDIQKMKTKIGDTHILLLKTHPLVMSEVPDDCSDFVYDVSDYANTNELLPMVDLLISDYSSVPFEYSFLKRPMIFYAYDLQEYLHERGIWEPYEEMMPGPIAKDTDSLLALISEGSFDYERIQRFHGLWNTYSYGNSSKALVSFLIGSRQRYHDDPFVSKHASY